MRVARRLQFLLPTVSTGLVRALQLVVLLVLSNSSIDDGRHLLVAGFGLLSAFAMMTDSGAGNFLLSTRLEEFNRGIYNKAVSFHFGLAVAGSMLAVLFILIPAGGHIPGHVLVILVALAITQCIDSTTRIIRAPMMVAKRDGAYALPDLILFVLKLPILGAAFVQQDLRFLLVLPVPSMVVAAVVYWRTNRQLNRRTCHEERLYARILEFGVTGALSALFSQSPLLIGTLFLTLPQLATLAIVYRIIQALDLLPGTLSLQMIPRVRDRAAGPWAYWVVFLTGGAIVSLVVIAAIPLIEWVFDQSLSDGLIFILVAMSFAPKSANYALVAYLMGSGLIRVRFVVTAVSCAISISLSVVLVLTAGATGLAAVAVIVELLFAAVAYLALKIRERETSVLVST